MKTLKFCIVISLLMIANLGNAEIVTSINDGNWSDGSTWSTGTVPDDLDDVIIAHNLIIDIDITTQINITINDNSSLTGDHDIKIGSGNSLIVGNNAVLEANILEIENSGIVTIGASSALTLAGAVKLSADASFTSNGNLTCDEIELESGSNMIFGEGTVVDVENTLNMEDGSSLTITGILSAGKFEMDMNTTATFEVSSDVSISGNTEVKVGGELTIRGSFEADKMELSAGCILLVESDAEVVINDEFDNKTNSVTIDGDLFVENLFSNDALCTISGNGTICCNGQFEGEGETFGIQPTSDILDGACIPTELPVELISFDVRMLDPAVAEVSWSTATETNSDYFDVERSSDGTMFEQIGNVKAKGISNVTVDYAFLDEGILPGTIYYRLKQVDLDGKFEYFNIVAIVNEDLLGDCKMIVVPNPCFEKCAVKFEDCYKEESGTAKFAVYDAVGNVVYTSIPKNISNGEAVFSFDSANNLAPAIYVVRGRADATVMDKKVIIGK